MDANYTEGKNRLHGLTPIEIRYLGVWDTVAALRSLAHLLRAKRENEKRSCDVGKSPVGCARNARHARDRRPPDLEFARGRRGHGIRTLDRGKLAGIKEGDKVAKPYRPHDVVRFSPHRAISTPRSRALASLARCRRT